MSVINPAELIRRTGAVTPREEFMLQATRRAFDYAYEKVVSVSHRYWEDHRPRDYSITIPGRLDAFMEIDDMLQAGVLESAPKSLYGTVTEIREGQRRVGHEFQPRFALPEYTTTVDGRTYHVKCDMKQSIGDQFEKMMQGTPGLAEPDGGRPSAGADFARKYAAARSRGELDLVVSTKSRRDFDLLLVSIQRCVDAAYDRYHGDGSDLIEINIGDQWSNWRQMRRPGRSFDSLALPAGVAEDLIADVDRFLADEERYAALSIPYRRGYLLHGPPGTGKTSIVKAVATRHKRPIYVLNPASVKDDSELMTMVTTGVQDNSVILIEDIDSFSIARDRNEEPAADGETRGPTLSGLLNALDGVATPHGMLIFVSTNQPGKLDEALVRDGRLDKHIHLGYVDSGQVDRLLTIAYGDDYISGYHPIEVPECSEISPATVVEAIKSNFWDVNAAVGEIVTLFDQELRDESAPAFHTTRIHPDDQFAIPRNLESLIVTTRRKRR